MQVNVASECDRAGEPDTGGYIQVAAALLCESVDGPCECFGVQGHSVTYGSEVGKAYPAVGNLGAGYAGHLEGEVII